MAFPYGYLSYYTQAAPQTPAPAREAEPPHPPPGIPITTPLALSSVEWDSPCDRDGCGRLAHWRQLSGHAVGTCECVCDKWEAA